MIAPRFSSTHYYYSAASLASSKVVVAPHTVNLFLDYNCPFSAKLFLKLRNSVIPKLQERYPNQFQFMFVNVVQPWHPNSEFLTEFSLVLAKVLKNSGDSGDKVDTNKLFWDASQAIFENKELFYDSSNVNLGRNEIYDQIASLVFEKVQFSFSKDRVLKELVIEKKDGRENQSNAGNGATTDVKYFTKYLRGVGVHVTPTVSIDGIVNDSVSSGSEPSELIEIFEKALD